MTNKIVQYAKDGAKYGAVAGTTAAITVGAIGVLKFLMAVADPNCKNEATCVDPLIAIGIVVLACCSAESVIGASTLVGAGLGAGAGLVHEGYSFFNKPEQQKVTRQLTLDTFLPKKAVNPQIITQSTSVDEVQPTNDNYLECN